MPIGSVGGVSGPYFPENVGNKTEGDYRDKLVNAYTAVVLYVLNGKWNDTGSFDSEKIIKLLKEAANDMPAGGEKDALQNAIQTMIDKFPSYIQNNDRDKINTYFITPLHDLISQNLSNYSDKNKADLELLGKYHRLLDAIKPGTFASLSDANFYDLADACAAIQASGMINSPSFDAFTKKINNYVANYQNFSLEDHTNMWIDIWRSGKELTDLKEAFDKKYGM